MNRHLFNWLWMTSLFLRLAVENRFTIALNRAFFWVGLTWICYDILTWVGGKARHLLKR